LYRCRVMLSFIYIFLLRYSFLLFSMPRIIFLVYSAVTDCCRVRFFSYRGIYLTP
jgi:hypothetical protein